MLDSIRCLPEAEDPLVVARILIDSISREESRFTTQLAYGPHVGSDLVDWVSGNCRELTDRLTYIFRAVGIPCGCDYMPLRGDANVAHYWNFVLDKERKTYYMYEKKDIGTAAEFYGARAKVYRKRYSLNERIQSNIPYKLEKVHPAFRYPMYEDVTRVYGGDLSHSFYIDDKRFLQPVSSGEMVYLCQTSQMKWIPVTWSILKHGRVKFCDIEGRVVMCLAVYKDKELIPVTEPFELNKETGTLNFYQTNDTLEEVKLLNKYHQFHESFPMLMVGGTFEGSNYADFKEKDTLHIISEPPLRQDNVIYLSEVKPYRYARYYGPMDSNCDVAEVAFYSSHSDTCRLQGKVIGTPNGVDGDNEHDYTNVYDGNPSTSFHHDNVNGGWAGLDFRVKQPIARIVYTARNRENYIRAGDIYELFYTSGGEWHSVGIQVPGGDSLVYEVPKGTLLYLKNHSGGVDERIFDYHEGKQRYW